MSDLLLLLATTASTTADAEDAPYLSQDVERGALHVLEQLTEENKVKAVVGEGQPLVFHVHSMERNLQRLEDALGPLR